MFPRAAANFFRQQRIIPPRIVRIQIVWSPISCEFETALNGSNPRYSAGFSRKLINFGQKLTKYSQTYRKSSKETRPRKDPNSNKARNFANFSYANSNKIRICSLRNRIRPMGLF